MVDLVGDRGLPRLSPPHLYLTLSTAPVNYLLLHKFIQLLWASNRFVKYYFYFL